MTSGRVSITARGYRRWRIKTKSRSARYHAGGAVWPRCDNKWRVEANYGHYGKVELPQRLRDHLAVRKPSKIDCKGAIACSVLVPLVPDSGDYSVVYTLRSEHLPNHKGQVAFPGGKHACGHDADLLATALRESHEEVGIEPDDVEILGRLDDVYTMVTEYVITPFVGLLPPRYRYRPNPSEVDDVFTVTVTDLLDRAYHRTEPRDWKGQSYEVDVITAGRHRIWGATHAITTNLIDCLEALALG